MCAMRASGRLRGIIPLDDSAYRERKAGDDMPKMSMDVTGAGINPNKTMFYLGMLFVVLGALIGGGGLVGAIAAGEPGMIGFGVVFIAMFCGIGGFFAKIGHDNLHASDAVLQDGAAYLGKIFAYEPDYRVTMNGQPCLTLVVRYLALGEIQEARVNTGDVDVTRYPRGATVSIKVSNGMAALVPGSVCNLRLEREDDLMNPDFDPSGAMSSIGVSCPNCGANITVPIGMSRYCPYCNTKISVDAAGRVSG